MADKSVFEPVTPEQLQGPFSSFLTGQKMQEAQPTPPPQVPGGAGKALSIGYVADQFLKGVTRGRVMQQVNQENQRAKNLQVLQQYIKSVVADPNITEEGKQFAIQQYSRALGGEILDAAGKTGSSKGQKGDDPKSGGAGHHIMGAIKDLALGMTGGKAPKGKDVDSKGVIGSVFAEISQPQYQKQGIISQNLTDIEGKVKGLPPGATQEEAMSAIAPHLTALARQDEKLAATTRENYLSQFQPAPTPNTPAWYAREYTKSLGQQQPSSAAPKAGPPPGMSTTMFEQEGKPPAPETPGPPQAPQARAFNPTQMFLAEQAGYADAMKGLEYDGPDGKPVRFYGRVVNTPDGFSGILDAAGKQIVDKSGAPVDPSKIRPASTAEPRPNRWSADKVVADPTSPTGFSYISRSLDSPETAVTKGAPNPHPVRPRAGFNIEEHPQVVAAQAKNEALQFVGKMMAETRMETDPNNRDPNMRLSFPQYLLKVSLPQYYMKNVPNTPKGQQMITNVRQILDSMARSENVKTKADLTQSLKDYGVQAQQGLKDARSGAKMDAIQQQTDDLFGQMFGELDSIKQNQGNDKLPDLDEIIK